MKYPYAQLLAFLVSSRGWWRSFKILRRLIVTGVLGDGNTVVLNVKMEMKFPEYELIEKKEELTINGNLTSTE